jgi:hypothetical protein
VEDRLRITAKIAQRQERVGHLVRSELSALSTGIIKGDAEYLDDDLRKRIRRLDGYFADLRRTRISVSVRAGKRESIRTGRRQTPRVRVVGPQYQTHSALWRSV